LLRGEIEPASGDIRKADHLRIVYFDQNRELDPHVTLRRALAPESDSVVYQDRIVHVASWASRFLFSSDALNQPVGRLSGGERARVLIAQLMLQPADVLLLDEPTNDLDIPTLEILEESLLEYPGALILVTHDRYMMDRVATVTLGLDGMGGVGQFADYSQWDSWQRAQQTPEIRTVSVDSRSASNRKKLTYLETRDYATIEERIAAAEEDLRLKREAINDPAIASDGPRLLTLSAQIEEAEKLVDSLFVRWSELEEKLRQ
jgi:ABC transport system ATP-binding/permease protein